MCGGTEILRQTGACVKGLSPRVRGNPHPGALGVLPFRSIPACAGEPLCWRLLRALGWVYPRVCGGTSFSLDTSQHAGGLSPRVRGNRRSCFTRSQRSRRRQRSIPACAGEPLIAIAAPAEPVVYPRVCGGTAFGLLPRRWPGGLSPRVRGNRSSGPAAYSGTGSIPACAGEPRGRSPPRPLAGVYPRVCGGTWNAACCCITR